MNIRSVFDVALYLLSKNGNNTMSAMKLQKLCYYAQAWSLVWDDKPIFRGRIEAWANGPVCPELYRAHRGMFEVDPSTFADKGSPDGFSDDEQETMNEVFNYYGSRSPYWLSELTHGEEPWKIARKDLEPGDCGNVEITHAAMVEYYSALV